MITVRVSEDEFVNFRTITRSMGYRSVSDLARAALNSVVGDAVAAHPAIADRLDNLDVRLAKLERLRGSR